MSTCRGHAPLAAAIIATFCLSITACIGGAGEQAGRAKPPVDGASPVAGAIGSGSETRAAPAPKEQGRQDETPMLANRLSSASGRYLAAAAGQPVAWQPFDEVSFALAQALDRPILLDVGGTWCHWCRVMDEESYGDAGTAAFINRTFVPVKVDADERPDLDRRLQQAAQLAAKEGGWPLTLVLTPQGDVVGGGTYFPAQPLAGRPALTDLLATLATAYYEQREAVDERAGQVADKLSLLRDAGVVRGELGFELVDNLAESLLGAFDPDHGGFGRRAKSPPPQGIALALSQYLAGGDWRYLAAASKTLDAMAEGGIRDHLGGGFHRLTLDPRWQKPHFQLVGSLNGALLATYLKAHRITGDERYRAVAEGILDYLDSTLADKAQGGFFSGQDADTGAQDDGGYYTWTAAEIKAAVPAPEAAVLVRHYGVPAPAPAIKLDQEPPPKPVALHVSGTLATMAADLGMSADEARGHLESGRAHLRAIRAGRAAPAIDRAFFADRNGTLAAAYFEAYRLLGRSELRDTALRTVDRLLLLRREEGLLAHQYAGGEPVAPVLLDDQMAVAGALLDAFEVTRSSRYLTEAGLLLDRAIAVFWSSAGGFFDVAVPPGPGAAGSRQRPYDDGMTLGGNPLAAITLDRYAALASSPGHRAYAEETLRAFAGAAREYGPFAAGYALALRHHLSGDLAVGAAQARPGGHPLLP